MFFREVLINLYLYLHMAVLLKFFIIIKVLSPFYIFQVFSCALWYYDDYVYYASCIVFLSAVSIAYSLYSIRQNERALRDIIHSAASVTVFRKDTTGKQRCKSSLWQFLLKVPINLEKK